MFDPKRSFLGYFMAIAVTFSRSVHFSFSFAVVVRLFTSRPTSVVLLFPLIISVVLTERGYEVPSWMSNEGVYDEILR